MFEVIEPGLLTTVQDLGRFGWYHIGMPPSGAMDNFSFRVGNLLVGNDESAAGLEITFTGPTLTVTTDTIVAVTGAELSFRINNDPAALWRAHKVTKNDTISLGGIVGGARAYLCVTGGSTCRFTRESFDLHVRPRRSAAPQLAGVQAHAPPAVTAAAGCLGTGLGRAPLGAMRPFGGLAGRKLQEGDKLPFGPYTQAYDARLGRSIDRTLLPNSTKDIEVRVIMGMCNYRVKDESLADFLAATWEVSTEADRIGYRLKGPTFHFKPGEQPFGAGADPSNVVDLGYPVGSIQILADSKPSFY